MIMKTTRTVTSSRWRRIVCSLLLGAIAVVAIVSISSSRATNLTVAAKIAPWVVEHTTDGQQAEFIVVLADQADLSAAAMLRTKIDKGRFVRDALWNKAQTTQRPMAQWLRDRGIEHRS